MKIKVLAIAFTLFFSASITATSYAQVINSTVNTTVVDDDKDKNKKKSKDCKDAVKSDCKTKKACCGDSKLKDDSCKDKKSDKEKKSEGDKR